MIPFRGVNSGGTIAAPLPPGTGLRYAKIVVGNSTSGDVAADVDFLDIGDGAQLAAALAIPGADVWIRPGVYDLGLVGSPASPLAILAGNRVYGAGPELVTILTKSAALASQAAFTFAAGSSLEDLTVRVPVPTGATVFNTALFTIAAEECQLRNLRIMFDGVGAVANFGMRAVFRVTGSGTTRIDNCTVGEHVGYTSGMPATQNLGGVGASYLIQAQSNLLSEVTATDLIMLGGDVGVSCNCFAFLDNLNMLTGLGGVELQGGAGSSQVSRCLVACVSPGFAVGASIIAPDCIINSNSFNNPAGPVPGNIGIHMTATALNTNATGNRLNGWDNAGQIDLGAVNCVFVANTTRFSAAIMNDLDGSGIVGLNG